MFNSSVLKYLPTSTVFLLGALTTWPQVLQKCPCSYKALNPKWGVSQFCKHVCWPVRCVHKNTSLWMSWKSSKGGGSENPPTEWTLSNSYKTGFTSLCLHIMSLSPLLNDHIFVIRASLFKRLEIRIFQKVFAIIFRMFLTYSHRLVYQLKSILGIQSIFLNWFSLGPPTAQDCPC